MGMRLSPRKGKFPQVVLYISRSVFDRYQNKELLVPRVRKKKKTVVEQVVTEAKEKKTSQVEMEGEVRVPGTGVVFVKTWGCAHNSSDSEYMAGQLAAAGVSINFKNGVFYKS